MNHPVFSRRGSSDVSAWPSRHRPDLFTIDRAHQAGQASAEVIIIVLALIGGAVGLGLFGDGGGLAGQLIDSLRRFQQGFGYALSLAG